MSCHGGLGRQWETMRISLKFYSCVGSNHTTLDAIRMMQAATPFGAGRYREIVVHGSQVTVEHVGWPYQPQGLTSAQLNLPFCVATLLLEGDVFVDQFTDAVVNDHATHRAVAKGQGAARPRDHGARLELPAHGARRGASQERHALEQTVEAPRGSETSFAREADIVRKFKTLATPRSATPKPTPSSISCSAPTSSRAPSEIAEALANG